MTGSGKWDDEEWARAGIAYNKIVKYHHGPGRAAFPESISVFARRRYLLII